MISLSRLSIGGDIFSINLDRVSVSTPRASARRSREGLFLGVKDKHLLYSIFYLERGVSVLAVAHSPVKG